MPPKDQYFRANVGVAVINNEGNVLVLEREDIPGAWQLPQGGVQNNEEPIAAAKRELHEETGIDWDHIELLGEYPEWITYELPLQARSKKTGRGQAQRWFLVRYIGGDDEIKLDVSDQEFSDFRWVEPSAVIDLAPDFRRPVYEKLLAYIKSQAVEKSSRR